MLIVKNMFSLLHNPVHISTQTQIYAQRGSAPLPLRIAPLQQRLLYKYNKDTLVKYINAEGRRAHTLAFINSPLCILATTD